MSEKVKPYHGECALEIKALRARAEKAERERDFLVSEYERAAKCSEENFNRAAVHLYNVIVNARYGANADRFVKLLTRAEQAERALLARVDATRGGDAHDTIRELLAPLGIGPHDDVVQSVRELMARAEKAEVEFGLHQQAARDWREAKDVAALRAEKAEADFRGSEQARHWLIERFGTEAKAAGLTLLWTDGGGSDCPGGWHRNPYFADESRGELLARVKKLEARALPADTVKQVREALDGVMRDGCNCAFDPEEAGCEACQRARAALELLKEDK